jgi:hypothetical protein
MGGHLRRPEPALVGSGADSPAPRVERGSLSSSTVLGSGGGSTAGGFVLAGLARGALGAGGPLAPALARGFARGFGASSLFGSSGLIVRGGGFRRLVWTFRAVAPPFPSEATYSLGSPFEPSHDREVGL